MKKLTSDWKMSDLTFSHHIRRDQNGRALLEKSKPIERLRMQLKQGSRISGVRNIHREGDKKNDTCTSPSRQVSSVGYDRSSTIHQNAASRSQVTTLNRPVYDQKVCKMLRTG